MKRYYVAAGALLLGTSALAYAGSADKTVVEPVKIATDAKFMATGWDKSLASPKAEIGMADTSKVELASLGKDLQKFASDETDAKLMTASADSDAKLIMASAETSPKVEMAWADSAKVQTAAIGSDLDAKVQTASADKVETTYTGSGGPIEGTAPASAAIVQPSNANPERDARGIAVISDVAYVPPGFNGTGGAVGGPDESADNESYPPCTRERTDNCIQLYEHGVREALAANGGTTSAMGGPYEPVASDSADLAMNGDGTVDAAKGETSDTAIETASAETDASVADHGAYQGVGGPVEAQSGYPPCSPGPGDDRCLQLYEPGVTGAGN